MPRIKIILLLAFLTFLAFGNTLSNDLIGDAKSIYGQNFFYKDHRNIKRLFQKNFIMSPGQMGGSPLQQISFSGCLSYRPVTALSFFLDYFLWKERAWGHHLSNILLHLLACWLVFLFIFELTKEQNASLLAAILFCVHPIQSEILNHTGYRSDLLLAIFYLCAFLSYLKFRTAVAFKRKLWMTGVLACFGLSLFSKEAGLTLPAAILFYEVLWPEETSLIQIFLRTKTIFTGLFLAALGYLYVYLFVFPSDFYPKFAYFGFSKLLNFIIALKILGVYIKALVFPFCVNVLPPLYAPPAVPHGVPGLLTVMAVVLFCAVFIVKFFRKQRLFVFGMLWFFLNYLPVSNIVPIPNPLAFRFMYLPSVGFFMIVAVLLERGILKLRQAGHLDIGKILRLTLVAFYLCLTVPLNKFFLNNIVSCREMIRQYPDSSRPYWILGLSYLENKDYERAADYFQEFIRRNVNNPYIQPADNYLSYYMLGQCYVFHPELAVANFKKAMELNPRDLRAYVLLAKAFMLKKDFSSGVDVAMKAINLNDRFFLPYVYVIHGCAELGEFAKAEEFLQKVKRLAPDEPSVKYAEQFLSAKRGEARAKHIK